MEVRYLTESESKSKSIQFVNWILTRLEAKAERTADAADNHKLILAHEPISFYSCSWDEL